MTRDEKEGMKIERFEVNCRVKWCLLAVGRWHRLENVKRVIAPLKPHNLV